VAILPLVDGPSLLGVMATFFRHTIADDTTEVLRTFAALAARRLAGDMNAVPCDQPAPG